MVPVRTWQHRQQLVECHRSHGEIITNVGQNVTLFHECRQKTRDSTRPRPKKQRRSGRTVGVRVPGTAATSSICLHRCSAVSVLLLRTGEPFYMPGSLTWPGQDGCPSDEGKTTTIIIITITEVSHSQPVGGAAIKISTSITVTGEGCNVTSGVKSTQNPFYNSLKSTYWQST